MDSLLNYGAHEQIMLERSGMGLIAHGDYVSVRLHDDTLKCVVFLGLETIENSGQSEFQPAGTAFFLKYDRMSYLVTARHVARSLESTPFVLRCMKKDGTIGRMPIDTIRWIYHPNDNVDVALIPLAMNEKVDWRTIPEDLILDEKRRETFSIGVGDEVQIVGLYRLLKGKKRNLPIVHTGHIAMMPGDEPIPVRDTVTGELKYANGFLVEAQTFEGLSGSPVFARHTWHSKKKEGVIYASGPAQLLGLWRSAWSAAPDEVLSTQRPDARKVPVGMGIVEPIDGIIETLELREMVEYREKCQREKDAENAATSESALPTKDENPQHKEDFNSLLDAAVKGPKRDR
jgi:hypothetical protein